METSASEGSQPQLDLSSSESTTALVHYYRGEMSRANIWRQRLDVTTNWAIITTAAFLSFGFGNERMPHFVLILATIFVLFFLVIETRRYKYFDLFRWRIALLNENFFCAVIDPNAKPLTSEWRSLLSEELQHSRFKMSFIEAFGRRLRRNYSWIFLVLGFCWVTKVAIHPTPIGGFSAIFERADIFHLVPGWLVVVTGVVFNLTLFVIALATLRPRSEVVRIYPARKSATQMPNI